MPLESGVEQAAFLALVNVALVFDIAALRRFYSRTFT